jgi:hypothetical protein
MNMKIFNKYMYVAAITSRQRYAYTCSRMHSYTHIHIFSDSNKVLEVLVF